MGCPGDVVLGEVVGTIVRVPRVLAAGPGQLVGEGRDEVVERPGYNGVVVGGNIEGNDADGIANPWTVGEKGQVHRVAQTHKAQEINELGPRYLWTLSGTFSPNPSVTFENWADLPPYRNAPISVVLAQCKLHVKKWDSPKDGHDGIGEEEGTCDRRETILLPAHICPHISLLMWR